MGTGGDQVAVHVVGNLNAEAHVTGTSLDRMDPGRWVGLNKSDVIERPGIVVVTTNGWNLGWGSESKQRSCEHHTYVVDMSTLSTADASNSLPCGDVDLKGIASASPSFESSSFVRPNMYRVDNITGSAPKMSYELIVLKAHVMGFLSLVVMGIVLRLMFLTSDVIFN